MRPCDKKLVAGKSLNILTRLRKISCIQDSRWYFRDRRDRQIEVPLIRENLSKKTSKVELVSKQQRQ